MGAVWCWSGSSLTWVSQGSAFARLTTLVWCLRIADALATFTSQSGRGQPHSTTLARALTCQTSRNVLERLCTPAHDTDIVIYGSRLNAEINRNFEVFSAADFLVAITQHIPDKGAQMVRYYG